MSHTLVSVLAIFLFLGMLQLGFAIHTRNLAVSAASEGARRGALVGANMDEAIARTDDLLSEYLGANRARDITASIETESGFPALVVRVRTTLPILVNFGPEWLSVQGTAVMESERAS